MLLPDPPAVPEGLTARPPGPGDAAAVHALVVACDTAVLGRTDATAVQTAADLEAPGYDRERGGLLVLDADGRVVGWLWTEDDPEAGEVFLDPYATDPAVLRVLVAHGLAYAGSLAQERGRVLGISGGSFEEDRTLAGALAGAGLEVRRRFWRMRVDLDPGRSWAAPQPPPGVVLTRPDPADEETYLLLHRLHAGSFAEHWGHTDRSYQAWREQFDHAPGRDPQQWWVASVHGVPAGLLVGDDSRAEVGTAWVRTLGVLPAARGRGVAKALLYRAFESAAVAGRSAVGLAVDSENATGATAVYESVGMRVESVMLAWKGTVGPRQSRTRRTTLPK